MTFTFTFPEWAAGALGLLLLEFVALCTAAAISAARKNRGGK